MLLDSGDIVLIADSQGVMDSYEATGTAIDAKAPVAVLVNKGTASASEVNRLLCNSGSLTDIVISLCLQRQFPRTRQVLPSFTQYKSGQCNHCATTPQLLLDYC